MGERIEGEEEMVENEENYNQYKPWLTIILTGLSILLFIGINIDTYPEIETFYTKWIVMHSDIIRDGKYWGLVTNNFLHVEIWHIVFNLSWFWQLGKKIEFHSGKLFLLLLIISSAIIASIYQLSFGGSTGIGLSGVVYALIGFILIKSRTDKMYHNFLDRSTIIQSIAWLFVCLIITYLNILNIGNAAHFSGFIWGAIVGFLTSQKPKILSAVLCLIFFAIGTITFFWAPWSVDWLSYHAYNAHKNNNIEVAKTFYNSILNKDPENLFAKENLKLIKLHELGIKAIEYHQKNNYQEAKKLYDEMLLLDPENEFAKKNKALLPPQE